MPVTLFPVTQPTGGDRAASRSRRHRMKHTLQAAAGRPLVGLTAGSLALLAACGSGDTQAADGSDAARRRPSKTIVVLAAGAEDPRDEGPLRGRQGTTASSKGYEVIVQDPNLDPQKQVTDLQSVDRVRPGRRRLGDRGRTPSSMTALVKTAQEKKVPLILNGTPEDYGLDGLAARPLVLHHRLRGPGPGHRRGARQLHQREARRQGRGDLRGERPRHRRQGGARDRRQGGARRHRARRRDRHHRRRQRPRRRRRPTSATRCRATRT